MLWWWCMDYAQDGDLTTFSDAEIAEAAGWGADPEHFVAALVACGGTMRQGFLERDGEGTRVHDWSEYGGRLLELKAANAERMRKRRAGVVQSTCVARAVLHDITEHDLTEQDKTEPDSKATAVGDETAVALAVQVHASDLNKNGGKPKPESADTWEAYREAYGGVYKVEPVRNASVNSQLVQMVRRLGSDAPLVARFYLQHRGAYYVKTCHSVAAMLKDCEGLHTQWRAGVTIHQRDANETDRLSANSAMWDRVGQRTKARKEVEGGTT